MSEAVREASKKGRPVYRNVGIGDITTKYRMPPSAIVSILHRVSGAGLFLLLPFLLYLFQQSLLSESSFGYFAGIVSHPLVKIILLGLSGLTCTTSPPASATCSWTITLPWTRTQPNRPRAGC